MNGWAALAFVGGAAAFTYALRPAGAGPRPPTGRAPAAPGIVASVNQNAERPWVLVVTGDTDGYLSPCGCTKPMTGGIRRMASAVRAIALKNPTVLIDTGGLGGPPGVQGGYKAEAMAEALESLDAAAINLTARDVALGSSTLASVGQIARGRFVGSNYSAPPEGLAVIETAERGPFLLGGVSSSFGDTVTGARSVAKTARELGRFSVLMLDGTAQDALSLAQRVPGLGAIVYRRGGWPPDQPERAGSTVLLTPGEQGKAVVRMTLDRGRLVGYSAIRLGPEWPDDPAVTRFYRTYLRRVDAAGLLDQIARIPSGAFAGSKACAPCHAASYRVWAHSAHAHAYSTLETEGHGRDPDCVSCHVVGLEREGGFRSSTLTPDLGDVGCESCHGPAALHAAHPKTVKLARVGPHSCDNCHTAEQSPRFSFDAYWAKIAH